MQKDSINSAMSLLSEFVDSLSYIHPFLDRLKSVHHVFKSKDAAKLNAWYVELKEPSTMTHLLAKCAIAVVLKTDIPQTISNINSFLSYFPMDPVAMLCRAKLVMTSNVTINELTMSMALADLQLIVHNAPSFKNELNSSIARICLMLERYDEAVMYFNDAINNANGFPFEDLFLLGHLHTVQQNNPATGIVYFNRILEFPSLSQKCRQIALFGVGAAYAKQGNYGVAIALINAAYELAPIRPTEDIIFIHWMLVFKSAWYATYIIDQEDSSRLLAAISTWSPKSKKMQVELLMTKARFTSQIAYAEAANLILPLQDEDLNFFNNLCHEENKAKEEEVASTCSMITM